MSSEQSEDETVRGEECGRCCYEDCESEATTLVRFKETKPTLNVWFCGPHAGNAIKKHDDARTVNDATFPAEVA